MWGHQVNCLRAREPVCLISNLIKWPLDFPSSDYEMSVGEKEAPMKANIFLVKISLGFRDLLFTIVRLHILNRCVML